MSPDWTRCDCHIRNLAPTPDVTSTVSPSPATLQTRAGIAGAVAAAMALAVGELVSTFGQHGQSLVGGVGNEIVDRAAGGTVRFAIQTFGTADKTVLVVTIVVISLLLGAWLGRLSLTRAWAAPVGFGLFGLLGLVAGVRDPLSSEGVVIVAAVMAVVSGIVTLRVLFRVARTGHALPTVPPATATPPTERPGDDKATRRAFFGWAGAAGAFAATATVAARSLAGRSSVENVRLAVQLPPATVPPGEPAASVGDAFAIDGLTPYLVPNDDFYRIDTALVVPQIDTTSWTLSLTGMVDHPFTMSFDELLADATTEDVVTLSCVSNEVGGSLVGNAQWQGVALTTLLDRAGVQGGATQIVGKSVDGFTAGFPTEAAYDGRVALVAVGMNGEPLPVRHGFPARLVVAGLYGYVSATKWLREIHLTTWESFDGYWVPRGWSKLGPVKTESRIDVPARRDPTLPRDHPDRRRGLGPDAGHLQSRGAGGRRRLAGRPTRRHRVGQHVGPMDGPVGCDRRCPHLAGPSHRRHGRDADLRRGPPRPGRRDGLAHPTRHGQRQLTDNSPLRASCSLAIVGHSDHSTHLGHALPQVAWRPTELPAGFVARERLMSRGDLDRVGDHLGLGPCPPGDGGRRPARPPHDFRGQVGQRRSPARAGCDQLEPSPKRHRIGTQDELVAIATAVGDQAQTGRAVVHVDERLHELGHVADRGRIGRERLDERSHGALVTVSVDPARNPDADRRALLCERSRQQMSFSLRLFVGHTRRFRRPPVLVHRRWTGRPQRGHRAHVHRERMVLGGGLEHMTRTADVHLFESRSIRWAQLDQRGAVEHRVGTGHGSHDR